MCEGLHQKSIEAVIRSLRKQKIDSVAIALMNSFRNPVHGIMLSKALESAGFYLPVRVVTAVFTNKNSASRRNECCQRLSRSDHSHVALPA